MSINLLRIAILLGVVGALGVLGYAIASAPSRAPNYLGVRGLKRVRAQRDNPFFAQIEPFLRWFAVRVSSLIGDSMRARLDRLLIGSGDIWGLIPEEVLALYVLGGAAGLCGGVVYGVVLGNGMLYVVLATISGSVLPYFLISGEVGSRQKRIQQELSSTIDLISLGLSAGLDFPAAIRQVVEKSSDADEPLVEELNLILQELQVGKTRKQALQQFSERVPIESVKEFVGAIVQAEDHGNPLGEVLRVQAETSRVRRGVKAEELASKVSVKLVLPMTLLLVSVMILIVAPLMMDAQNALP